MVIKNDVNVVVIMQRAACGIPEHLQVINTGNMLEACLFPMTNEEFFSQKYQKKALVIKGQPEYRFD